MQQNSIDQLKEFIAKNREIIKEYNVLIEKAKSFVFKQSCLKEGLADCEHTYCYYHINNECNYFTELKKVNDIIDNL